MAAGSLLALLDDIASVLDDVTLMSKVAAKKTAGVLGDDLALNAQQVSGVHAERELPVVWAVAKGSVLNKAILVPAALLISAFVPWLIIPLLMIGGAFLCFEGFEKLAHKFLHSPEEDAANEERLAAALADEKVDLCAVEKDKIKGAIRTDFILSAEIIVISLGTVSAMPFMQQLAVLVIISLVMTVGVYGLVAGIVKIDDAGLYLSGKESGVARGLGRMLLATAPRLMKLLTIVGTAAMFMVGGGIIGHNWEPLHHFAEGAAERMGEVPVIGGLLHAITPTLIDALAGVVVGALVLLAVTIVNKIRGKKATADAH
jgi:predicted DNA repair protein MutK